MMTLETLSEEMGKKFELLSEKMDTKFARVDRKFEEMEHSILTKVEAKIDEKIDELAAMTARGFQEVNDRLLVIEEKVDVIEEKIDIIEENYVTKDDLMALEEHLESRFITV